MCIEERRLLKWKRSTEMFDGEVTKKSVTFLFDPLKLQCNPKCTFDGQNLCVSLQLRILQTASTEFIVRSFQALKPSKQPQRK